MQSRIHTIAFAVALQALPLLFLFSDSKSYPIQKKGFSSCPSPSRCDLLLQLYSRGKCILRIAFHSRQRLFFSPPHAPQPPHASAVGEVWSRFYTQTHACLWLHSPCSPAHTLPSMAVFLWHGGNCLNIGVCLEVGHVRLAKQIGKDSDTDFRKWGF